MQKHTNSAVYLSWVRSEVISRFMLWLLSLSSSISLCSFLFIALMREFSSSTSSSCLFSCFSRTIDLSSWRRKERSGGGSGRGVFEIQVRLKEKRWIFKKESLVWDYRTDRDQMSDYCWWCFVSERFVFHWVKSFQSLSDLTVIKQFLLLHSLCLLRELWFWCSTCSLYWSACLLSSSACIIVSFSFFSAFLTSLLAMALSLYLGQILFRIL